MKQIFRFAAIIAAVAGIFACQKEEGPDTEKELKAPSVTVDPTGKIILAEDAKTADALTISWTAVADDAEYTLNITKANEADYSKAWTKTTNETSVKFTTEELQQVLLGFGYSEGDNATVKAMVQAKSGELSSTSSDTRIQCVLYAKTIELNIPVLTLNATEITLAEASKDAAALTVTWTDASVEEVYVDYTVEITLATDTEFADAMVIPVEDALTYSITGNDLQHALYDLGYKAGETVNLACRVNGESISGNIEPVVSETVAFAVTLWAKPKNENIPTRGVITGDAFSWGWVVDAGSAGELTCTDAENGIFEWTGAIPTVSKTFKFLFDGSWKLGFINGKGDYFWTDVTWGNAGDLDYFRIMCPGTWKFVLDTYNVTIDRTLIETSLEYVTVAIYSDKDEQRINIPVKDKTKAIFEGPITIPAGCDFCVFPDINDQNRGFACHNSSPQVGTSWKMSAFREVDENNAKTPFQVPDNGEFTMTVDLINLTLTLQ